MPGGGKILLRFRHDEKEVVTEAEDTGPGIAPEIADRLFQPFATHGKSHGTGLGLSICKKIVGDHAAGLGCATNRDMARFFPLHCH
jgi:signal transduction histidine kinase